MEYLFTPEGEAALEAVLRRRVVFGFDFDGTLAPIVPRPDDARVPAPVAERLRRLAVLRPVAVVSGRAVPDLRGRLGFEPQHIVGSHGADDPAGPPTDAMAHDAALAPLRERLQRHADELTAHGVTLEDKGQSIALHYRGAPAVAQARALLRRLLEPPPQGVHLFAGKRVVNASASIAPDKARAMLDFVRRAGGECAFFAGDDVNDEPVFAAAPVDWLTVRVGRGRGGSRARFFIEGPRQMAALLERALQALDGPARR